MSTETVGQIPQERIDRLKQKMQDLQQAQAVEDPNMANYLKDVHALVMTYPETVWCLTDDEMKAVVDAAQKHANKVIIEEKVKAAKSSRGKSVAKLGMDDF